MFSLVHWKEKKGGFVCFVKISTNVMPSRNHLPLIKACSFTKARPPAVVRLQLWGFVPRCLFFRFPGRWFLAELHPSSSSITSVGKIFAYINDLCLCDYVTGLPGISGCLLWTGLREKKTENIFDTTDDRRWTRNTSYTNWKLGKAENINDAGTQDRNVQ